jgi:hypothetical protein
MAGSPLAVGGLTLVAAVLLGFDGAVVGAVGVYTGRWLLVAIGLVLLAGAGLVMLAGRRQRRGLDEIAAVRRDLRDETEALRRLLER